MLLKDYIPNVNKKFRNVFFSGISFDSKSVKKNNIFFAIKGNEIDGNKFIPLAIKNGSKIIVSEKKFKKKYVYLGIIKYFFEFNGSLRSPTKSSYASSFFNFVYSF